MKSNPCASAYDIISGNFIVLLHTTHGFGVPPELYTFIKSSITFLRNFSRTSSDMCGMPISAAARAASAAAEPLPHDSDIASVIINVIPVTLYPDFFSRRADTVLSTPPLIPSRTFFIFQVPCAYCRTDIAVQR